MRKSQLAPPRFCVSCGLEFALAHRVFCADCFIAAQRRRKELSRLRAQRHRDRKAGKAPSSPSTHYDNAELRANPINFKASIKAMKRQVQWMKENNLLPDPRRADYDEELSRRGRLAYGKAKA